MNDAHRFAQELRAVADSLLVIGHGPGVRFLRIGLATRSLFPNMKGMSLEIASSYKRRGTKRAAGYTKRAAGYTKRAAGRSSSYKRLRAVQGAAAHRPRE
jgi:hypothetical protein